MPATAEDRTSDSIEALGSGQLNPFRTWDLYFPNVCCISLVMLKNSAWGHSREKCRMSSYHIHHMDAQQFHF